MDRKRFISDICKLIKKKLEEGVSQSYIRAALERTYTLPSPSTVPKAMENLETLQQAEPPIGIPDLNPDVYDNHELQALSTSSQSYLLAPSNGTGHSSASFSFLEPSSSNFGGVTTSFVADALALPNTILPHQETQSLYLAGSQTVFPLFEMNVSEGQHSAIGSFDPFDPFSNQTLY